MNKKILYIATLMLAMTSVAFAQNDDDVTAMRLTFNSSATIVPDGLSEASAEGTVGVLDGVEAIVVDLGGSIGKVAIATKNYGASSETERGYGFGYDNAMLVPGTISGTYYDFGEGWYLPSKTELDALINRLTWNSTREGAEINFGETSLFLPASGYRYNGSWYANGSQCVYWSSTPNGSQAYRMDMSSTSKSVMSGNRTTGTPLRTFHALPKVTKLTAPIEREHNLEVSSITNTSDGIRLTVNGQEVEYPFEMLKEMTFFNGTPTVTVKANEDPDNAGNYYSTFYSSLEAYNIPDGVKAYTAEEVEGEEVKLTEVEGDILPRDEAVLLYSTTISNMAMTVADDNGSKSQNNQFDGVDVTTEQDGSKYYMLSYGQKKLGFYQMSSDMMLSPNKAFIEMSQGSAKALRFVLPGEDTTNIENINEIDNENENNAIYNLQGVRMNKLQKGINIVNGKKIVVK